MSRITNFLYVIWIKKDTHGVFICITPNWNFSLKNTAPISSTVRRKPPHLDGTPQNGRKTNSKSLPYFLDLEPRFSEIQFRAASYKLKRRQKNYWSSSYICICMSCSPRFHPDITILHVEKPALIETGASALGKLAALAGERSLSLSEGSVILGVFCKNCQRWRAEGKGAAPQRKGESKFSCKNNMAWQKARGDAGRTE